MFLFLRKWILGKPLMKDWVLELEPYKQSTLVSVLRGSDSNNGNDIDTKAITKMLRYLIVNDVKNKSTYMNNKVLMQQKTIDTLVNNFPNNRHWVEHVLSAAFHIKDKHPDNYVREYWAKVLYTCNNRNKKWLKNEKKRIELEKYIKRVIDKYTEIYMVKGI